MGETKPRGIVRAAIFVLWLGLAGVPLGLAWLVVVQWLWRLL